MHGPGCSPRSARTRPRHELANLVRSHGEALRRSQRLSAQQQRVLRDIVRCRTAALGGHVDVCANCSLERPAYNSCRNRHCPKCQALPAQRWLERRQDRLLPTHYFHVVFTLPNQLHPLCRHHPEAGFGLLFAAAAQTLLCLGRDRKWLGAQLGITAVLHTWTRDLRFHPHLHCIVTGGGLSTDAQRWVATSPDFLFPVHVASALFRGKFLAALRDSVEHRRLVVPSPQRFSQLCELLYPMPWVVYCKPPFGGPEHVFRYLSRYTHRIAISNYRLLSVTDRAVRFRTHHGQSATLRPLDFLRRFIQHVLPSAFVRIRHYGLLASRNVSTQLQIADHLLAAGSLRTPKRLRRPSPDWRALFAQLTGTDLRVCPRCGQRSLHRRTLPPVRAPPQATVNPRAA